MKKILFILSTIIISTWMYSAFAVSITSVGCSGMNCFLAGVKDAGRAIGVTGVVTGKGISQAVQDFIIYLLSFLSLLAVIYIMYAGAQLLLNPASEEGAAKTKKIIIGVIGGIVIIWFAWWIVSSIFYVVNKGAKKVFIPRAVAETQMRNVDFTTYSNSIGALRTKLDSGYSSEVMSELTVLVDGAFDHMPDRADLYKNKQLYDSIKKAISEYNLHQEIIDRGILQTALRDFLEQTKVYTMQSQPEATPRSGDAPLSVTLEAKQTIDESGTVIPNDNYIWWLRTEGGTKKVIGKGNITNYTFENSGTFMVFLTINSASKNSRGFTDVINYENSIVIEVGQPKVQFVVRVNDQIAQKVVKISTKDALKPIRIDASETRFSSGYTIQTTEWDFGNSETDTNEGNPQFESQMYTPGDHTIKLKLLRNDGEEYSYSFVLKIGDPLASISTTSQKQNKGDRAVFQARKTSNEPDVQYVWEVKKQGMDAVLYNFSGTRMEYIFQDTGKFFVTLTSIKGDARDKDTVEVNIESRPPNVQFTSEVFSPEMPNVYTFDGTSSFDPDYPDNQKLRFEWLVNDAIIQLSDTNQRNSRGKYAFPEKGTYRVVLRVTDDEGKSKDSTREIRVTSTLSIALNMRPEVVKRGGKIMLSVTAPRAKSYEWKIGSLDPVRTENNRFITSLPTAGTYPVTITVTDIDGDTNSATGKIYVSDDDKPFGIIDLKSDSVLSIGQTSTCSNEVAVILDRAHSVTFSADRSVNKNGKNADLTYFWNIGMNKNSTQKSVTYTFDELGCEEITLTVTDKMSGATYSTKMWVKVVNLPPIFNDLQVDIENLDTDPMRVSLKLLGAKDPDGIIRSYTWYYFTDRDDQPQGFRITRTPEATFVLPKITGRYYFAVMMEDSNGLKVNTKEARDVLYSTPDLYVNTNLSTPIIENFRADKTEVKFGETTKLSLEVRTPVTTDITDKSEYRWDIDGDGFYDVKTTTPFYEFKYVYPGEYNPKVKVTYKGISSTKSLTIVVRNALVAKASVLMIGSKIVAYNTSSGVFQTTNWYLDNKKISDNKDYLFSEVAGSASHILKIEISDGKSKEVSEYTIQSNQKNKILLKKITRKLVVLSSLTGDATEVPDEIIWDNPSLPLFLYLGESRGDIKYYAIDTDVDIDTDLSGGKDDDADNKGTASYGSGRPFLVPVGTKRTTDLRIRIIGTNGEDIDTRQIRVVREFLVTPEVDLIPDSTQPQIFHLSQEDKDRIEKLRNLVQGAPEEEKAQFNKILDQLGDNWYDVAERIQTLNLFSNAVNASSNLTDDLKKRILEQISIVYTQGDDQVEEKQLALKMITDYLSKSTKKLQIFGDSQTPGLINEIIDSPEYYDANLKIVNKIMDDYVNTDANLSDEVKKDINSKLLILAGSPPASDVPINGNDDNASGNIFQIFLWVMGGVVSIVLGGVGIVYARQKIVQQSKNIPNTMEDVSQKNLQEDMGITENGAPDWLKEDVSPFGSEDVFSAGVTQSTSADESQPDWLKDTSAASTSDTANTKKTEPQRRDLMSKGEAQGAKNDIPDWLQEPDVPEGNIDVPSSSLESNSAVSSDDDQVGSPSVDMPDIPSDFIDDTKATDMPDWLQGVEDFEGGEGVEYTDRENVSVSVDGSTDEEALPSVVKENISSGQEPESDADKVDGFLEIDDVGGNENALLSSGDQDSSEKSENGNSMQQIDENDIPDWLQGASMIEAPTHTEPFQLRALGEETMDGVTSSRLTDAGVSPSIAIEREEVMQDSILYRDDTPDVSKDSTGEDQRGEDVSNPPLIHLITSAEKEEIIDTENEIDGKSIHTLFQKKSPPVTKKLKAKKQKKEPIKKKPITKIIKKLDSSVHLLESEHDMLLSPPNSKTE